LALVLGLECELDVSSFSSRSASSRFAPLGAIFNGCVNICKKVRRKLSFGLFDTAETALFVEKEKDEHADGHEIKLAIWRQRRPGPNVTSS
jgi:hypothetical protein